MKKVLPFLLITAFILSGLHTYPLHHGEVAGTPFFTDSSSHFPSGAESLFRSHQVGEEEVEVRGHSRGRAQLFQLPEEPAPAPLISILIDREEALGLPAQHIDLSFSLRAPPVSELFTTV